MRPFPLTRNREIASPPLPATAAASAAAARLSLPPPDPRCPADEENKRGQQGGMEMKMADQGRLRKGWKEIIEGKKIIYNRKSKSLQSRYSLKKNVTKSQLSN
ncbi:hypothetical protein Dimus_038392 [Dionaea muscipula]